MLCQLKAMYDAMLQPPENQPYMFASLRSLQECVRSLNKRVGKLHSGTKKFANTLLGRGSQNPQQSDKSPQISATSFEDVIFHLAQ